MGVSAQRSEGEVISQRSVGGVTVKRRKGKVSALILEGVVSVGGVANQSHRVRSLHRLERVGLFLFLIFFFLYFGCTTYYVGS